MTEPCCTPVAPCRRCRLWDESAAAVPIEELRPCALCEEPWNPKDLAPRTGLCPACRTEILEAIEDEPPEPECDARELARRVEERRRAEFERARKKLREMEAVGWGVAR